jgi:hypothetical protein
MRKIYKGQTALRIVLRTFTDLEGVAGAEVRYKKPDGVCGSFPAGVSGGGEGVIFHECLEGDIDMAGWWSFWAFVTFADGRSAAGEPGRVFVWEEGAS